MKLIKCFSRIVIALACILAIGAGYVHAEEEKVTYIAPIDVKSITKYVEQDNWSYDPATKTLTLAGVNFSGYAGGYSYTENEKHMNLTGTAGWISVLFDVYPGTTIVVKEGTVNHMRIRNGGACVYCGYSEKNDSTEGVTITGGGTLDLYGGEIALNSDYNFTVKDVTINYKNGDILGMIWPSSYNNPNTEELFFTVENSTIDIKDCTGGIYLHGWFCNDLNKEWKEDAPFRAVSLLIKDSNITTDIIADTRNHHSFFVRNGDLIIDHSTLNLKSAQESVVAWRMYRPTETSKSIISITDSTVDDTLEIAGSKKEFKNGYIYGETFVKKGDKTVLDFTPAEYGGVDYTFNHKFENGATEVKITAIPKYTVSFDLGAGTVVGNEKMDDRQIIVGKPIGKLPVLEQSGKIFVGWSTKPNATTADVTEDTIVTADMKLYPVWQDIPKPAKDNIKVVEQTILTANTDKKDIAGSTFGKLQLKAKGGNKQVKLTWKKVKGATGYVVYGSACGSKMKKLKQVSAKQTSYTAKKLKKGKYYKYVVVALNKDKALSIAKSVHEKTNGGKKGNPIGLKVKQSKIAVKTKKTKQIKVSVKSKKKYSVHIAKVRYESSNERIATVSNKGVVKGIKKGKCTIYAYTQNGICKKISVQVK